MVCDPMTLVLAAVLGGGGVLVGFLFGYWAGTEATLRHLK